MKKMLRDTENEMGTKTKRAVSLLLVMVMIVTTLPVSVLHTNAADTSNLPVLGFVDEYSAKSSTAIKTLNNFINASGNSAKYATLLKRTGGYAALIGGSVDAIRGAIASYDSDDKWYENIWNIGSGAIAGFLGLNASDTTTPAIQYNLEEMKSIILDMDADIQAIKTEIDNLEEVIQTNFHELSGKISDKIEETEYKQFLNEFTQVNNRNAFSYYAFFKPDLNQFYVDLLKALEGGNEDNIKQAYDNLYLVAKQTDQLYYYISGESRILSDKQSIQDILYDYSVKAEEENFELTCVEFAEDVNSTFFFSQYCLSLCYNYQLLYAQMNDKSYDSYYYVQQKDTSIESIQYASISTKITEMLQKQEIVTKHMAQYMCKVLRLNGEFDYSSRGIRFGTIPYSEISDSIIFGSTAYQSTDGSTVYYRVNNKLQNGDVIRICEMPDEYMSMFNPKAFSISVSNGNAKLLPDGSVQVVGSSGTFEIIYSYDGAECYRSTFSIVKNYSGGMGIEKAPYLISTPSDFNKVRYSSEKCYYLLINDINFNGASLPLLWIDNIFNGVFDGGCHKIYNYQISGFQLTSLTFCNALFPQISTGGVVKNLMIGSTDCANFDGYSVKYNTYQGYSGNSISVYSGILAGKTYGSIVNCQIQNARLVTKIFFSGGSSRFSIQASTGAFAASNYGTIQNCQIERCNLDCQYRSNYGDCYSYLGGIAGDNAKTIDNCFSIDSTLYNVTESPSQYVAYNSVAYTGFIVGRGNASSVYYNGMRYNMNAGGLGGGHKIIGTMGSALPGTANASRGWMSREDGRVVLDFELEKNLLLRSVPHKTVYFYGEPLNLCGLELRTKTIANLGAHSEQSAYGYTVSGYDPTVIGKQTVTVTCGDKSVTFEVEVVCQHVWSGGTVTIEPTETQDGAMTYTCSDCHETKIQVIPSGSIVKPLTVNTNLDCDYEIKGNVVTVTYAESCKVGYLSDGKYIAINAVANSDGSYSFTAPDGVSEVLLVLCGDANLDGRVTAADIARINASKLGKTAITSDAIFAGDVDRNSAANDSDIDTIKNAVLRISELNW